MTSDTIEKGLEIIIEAMIKELVMGKIKVSKF